jgi:hypothetical protein
MKNHLLSILVSGIFFFTTFNLSAQVAINSDGSTPDVSAMIDVKSNTKGALLPRMTQVQIGLISSPANGLVVFCTTDNKFYAYISSTYSWKELMYGSGSITPTCGSSITINHLVSGGAAPIDKATTYGTVTNIPGEPTKCWITSNLGADHQATAINDATEASAGWYWQFNRKQGYKHDGTTLTPPWTITTISENSDWLTANDPCNLEIGIGWRVPTYTEWYNVNFVGGWTTWNGSWNSGLKLHGAGFLDDLTGGRYGQGEVGHYRSSTQFGTTICGALSIWSSASIMGQGHQKANGFTVRCLRD